MGFKPRRCVGPILVAALWLAAGCHTSSSPSLRIVHAEDSSIGPVFVVDEGELRYLRFERPDGDDQSVISLGDPSAVPMDYIRTALAGLAWADRLERVLMIGLGAGTFTTAIHRALPEVELDAVEISPVVVRVAQEWFGLPRSDRYRIHFMDGQEFLRASTQRWDVIFLDAYTEDSEPDLMRERAAFEQVRARLSPGGVALLNLSVDEPIQTRALEAFAAVFGRPTCLEASDGVNLVVIGRQDGRALGPGEAVARAEALARRGRFGFDLVEEALGAGDCPSVP